MIKFRDIIVEAEEVKLPANLKKLVYDANVLIDKCTKEDWYAIEPDGTWESMYEFKPITVKGKFITVEYSEPLDGNKKYKDKYSIDDYDIVEVLRWAIRALKKGYRNNDKA